MSQNITVYDANNLFRQGHFERALYLYKAIAANNGPLSGLMKANIQKCEQKIAINGSYREAQQGLTSQDLATLAQASINPAAIDALPDPKSILLLLDSLESIQSNAEHVAAILVCASASPFQRDLLWYAASTLSRCGLLLPPPKESNEAVCLQELIWLASNIGYWLLHRERIKKFFLKCRVADSRAWELVSIPPDALDSDEPRALPTFRPASSKPYTWTNEADRSGNSSLDSGLSRLDFGTILLNEKKFIGRNILQHYNICNNWILVEGACQGYPTRKVSDAGLSRDNSSIQIRLFPDPKGKLRLIQYGWTKSDGEAAKSELRNQYLAYSRNDFLLVVDADEFYIQEDISIALAMLQSGSLFAVTLPQVHFWKDTSRFITGEYYDISHTRLFKNIPGMRYIKNHNFPEIGEQYVQDMGSHKFARKIVEAGTGKYKYDGPCCFHMGFAKDYDDMRDKSDYYINRGEKQTRKSTTESRAAWFDDQLPEKCNVRGWGGALPNALD